MYMHIHALTYFLQIKNIKGFNIFSEVLLTVITILFFFLVAFT